MQRIMIGLFLLVSVAPSTLSASEPTKTIAVSESFHLARPSQGLVKTAADTVCLNLYPRSPSWRAKSWTTYYDYYLLEKTLEGKKSELFASVTCESKWYKTRTKQLRGAKVLADIHFLMQIKKETKAAREAAAASAVCGEELNPLGFWTAKKGSWKTFKSSHIEEGQHAPLRSFFGFRGKHRYFKGIECVNTRSLGDLQFQRSAPHPSRLPPQKPRYFPLQPSAKQALLGLKSVKTN